MSSSNITSKFSVKKAHKTQLQMSKQIMFEDRVPETIRLVAGVDIAYSGDMSIGAVAVLDYDSLKLAESQIAFYRIRFPYIPTLLSFREVPPAVLCVKKLRVQPDVFLADGHGFAHPCRCGFASHLGLVISKPTIGVAKSRLFGEVENFDAEEHVAFLKDRNEVIGAAVETKTERKPVYVSVGHMVSLKTAIRIVKHVTKHSRIPEPILRAHEIAAAEKRKSNITLAK